MPCIIRWRLFLIFLSLQRLPYTLFKEETMSDDIKVAPDGITPTRTLDAKGLSCPMPLLRTKKEMDKINAGEILEILGTDPGSRNDLPGWCTRSGHVYLGEKEDSGFFRFYIQKK